MDNRDYLALNAELKKELEQSYDANYMVKKEACESYELSQKLFLDNLTFIKLHKLQIEMIRDTGTHNEKRFLCSQLIQRYNEEIRRLTEIIIQGSNYKPGVIPF